MPSLKRLSAFAQEYWIPALTTAVILLISVWLQIQVSRSPMTLGEDIWQQKLNLHLTSYPFSIRPFQSYATLWLHNLTALPIRESFFFLQFGLAFSLGLVFYAFLRRLTVDRTWSLIGVVLLMTAYPILGAHYAPTHTWDDFWGYLFLTLAFLSLLKRQPLIGALWLTLGAVAREPIAVFLPVYFLALWWERSDHRRWRLAVAVLLPLVTLVLFRLVFGQETDITRWSGHLDFNFGTALKRSDTLVSTIIAFGWLWPLSLAGLLALPRREDIQPSRLIAIGWVVALPLTVLLTLTGGRAIETRIFFPPFIFVIPLALVALRAGAQHIRSNWRWPTVGAFLLSLICLCAVGVVVSERWLFPEFSYKTNATVRQDLVGVYLGACLTGLGAFVLTRWRQIGDKKTTG